MGMADDILKSFWKQYPEAQSGKLSREELNGLLVEFQEKRNNISLDDFDGLSPKQMHFLIQDPLGENSLLQFNKANDAHLDNVPLFKLSELLLTEIRNVGKLKLTTNGNLPVAICELLYSQNLIKWEYMEYLMRIREEEIPYLGPIKYYLLDQEIVKMDKNMLVLTKTGEGLMMKNTQTRFTNLFLFFCNRYHWGNFYGLDDNGKCGQLGWAFSLVLLSKYGNVYRESQFYSLKLMQAFEKPLLEIHKSTSPQSAIQDYSRTYEVRFFECFAGWFGLVDIEMEKNPGSIFSRKLTVKKSTLFDQLFKLIAV